jgi:hypothetical protein
MKIKSGGGPGRTPTIAPACVFPRSRYHKGKPNEKNKGNDSGLIGAGSNRKKDNQDRAEVQEYLKNHPNATNRDVAMECHVSKNQASRLRESDKWHSNRKHTWEFWDEAISEEIAKHDGISYSDIDAIFYGCGMLGIHLSGLIASGKITKRPPTWKEKRRPTASGHPARILYFIV